MTCHGALLGQHEQLICPLSESSVHTAQYVNALNQQVTRLFDQVASLVTSNATHNEAAAAASQQPMDSSHVTLRLLTLTWAIAIPSFSSAASFSSSALSLSL